MLGKRIIRNWGKIRLSRVKYYCELFLEEFTRFNYPLRGIKKYTINVFKLNRIKKIIEKK